MDTRHHVHVADAGEMHHLGDGEVDLVVTSPPYPMIEMWDGMFANLDPEIGAALEDGDGQRAFERMHVQLERTWSEVARVLADGGIACVNVGDATRRVDGSFQLWPNHVRVVDAFRELGFQLLPAILWRKPTNSATKFMGSGMLPPNAYATLEHEYVLILRKGDEQRSFEPNADRRYEAAYFWEERNRWFSDVWTDVRGTLQELENSELRERSAAYPFEIPFRLISMYSAYGDTVLDPFWGTGTTTMAAMAAGRGSVGYEVEEAFVDDFRQRVASIGPISREVARDRIDRHLEFVERRRAEGVEPGYEAEHYGFPVTTTQEKRIRLYAVDEVRETDRGYVAEHRPVDLAEEPLQERSCPGGRTAVSGSLSR